jgi:hypothetical protein
MAFNWTTFWTRTFTALIFVAVMAAGLLGSYTSFFCFNHHHSFWMLVRVPEAYR